MGLGVGCVLVAVRRFFGGVSVGERESSQTRWVINGHPLEPSLKSLFAQLVPGEVLGVSIDPDTRSISVFSRSLPDFELREVRFYAAEHARHMR
jgi:hypothetical protein